MSTLFQNESIEQIFVFVNALTVPKMPKKGKLPKLVKQKRLDWKKLWTKLWPLTKLCQLKN